MENNNVYFYINSLGCNGKISLCNECIRDSPLTRAYLVRGGTGVKSQFIKDVSSSLMKEGLKAQLFLNFLDSSRLDGAYFPEIDTYLLDADFSYIHSPLIGSCQYNVDLGQAEDKKELYSCRALILKAMSDEEKYVNKAVKFLSTVKSIRDDTVKISNDSVNAEKTERFVSRLVKKEFGSFSQYPGREYFRFLSSVTPDGIRLPESTFQKMCPKIYIIEDKTNVVSRLLLTQIRDNALLCGFDVISLLNPLEKGKSPEHLIVPELGLGIFTSNRNHKYSGEYFKKISSTRFVDSEKIKNHKTRINFNLGAEKELLNQAYFLLDKAKTYRDEYLNIYERHTDMNKIKEISDKLKTEMLSYI